jgi:hypothetical protein
MGSGSDEEKRGGSAVRERLNPGDEAPPGTAGTGEALCPDCAGSGKLEGKPCPTCGGSGHVTEGIGGA